MRRANGPACYCTFEDTRLFGFAPEDFPTFLSLVDEHFADQPVFLDEVQEVPEWQRLVRALVDRQRAVCVTGSNASLLGRELGTRLTGRHDSHEVFPFSYSEFCAYTRAERGPESLREYLDAGGFPGFLRERHDQVLQELLRDVIYRDVAARHGLRDTRHVMNLLLFLLAHAGQTFSFQRLTKVLAVPTVAQTSRYVSFLEDAYLLFGVPKFSPSFRRRVVAPVKYFPIDCGLSRANSPQSQPDLGRRLETIVALHLRRRRRSPAAASRPAVAWAGERDSWECDFITADEAIQVCFEVTPANRARELTGAVEAARLPGRRRPRIVTFDQSDRLREDDVEVEIVPAWRWLSER
jgi:predicted AAA+ superfamily ATPase